MTDDWLKEIEKKKIVGAVLLAAFDSIDHELMLEKLERYCFSQSELP